MRDERPILALIVCHAVAAAMLGLAVHAAQAAPTSFTVRSVTVEQDGQWHEMRTQDQSPAQCARFHLTKQAALRWFRHARDVTEHSWRADLDWTQCSAAGRLATGNGQTLSWQLDQAGRARVTISSSVYLGRPELPFRR